jgi:hypothetical protein
MRALSVTLFLISVAILPARAQNSGGFIAFGPSFSTWDLTDFGPYDGAPVISSFRAAFFVEKFYLGYAGTRSEFFGRSSNVTDATNNTHGFMMGYRWRPAGIVRASAQLTTGRGRIRIEEAGGTVTLNERYYNIVPEAALGLAPTKWLVIEARAGYQGAIGSVNIEPIRQPYGGIGIVLGTN